MQVLSRNTSSRISGNTIGEEHSGKSSKSRFRRMKEAHDEAKNRLFIAAAENGIVDILDWHVQSSAAEAAHTPVSQEETARLHEQIEQILAKEKEDRHRCFHEGLTTGWKMPKPAVMKGERPTVKLTPASPSGPPVTLTPASSSGPSVEAW